MATVRYTRNLFLRGMCAIYLFAFLSLYIQIPGLNGTNGVLPARCQMDTKTKLLNDRMNEKPTLVWLAPYLGLDTEYTMDLIALLGTFIAFIGFTSQSFCTAPLFAMLWALYLSLFQVNPVFLGFQWDVLLLEAGFLTIFVAPLWSDGRKKASPADSITFWSIRWLLFRLMFSSGIVKFTSGCPTWWGLTALEVHFESQCIPTPAAWYAHYLPTWILRLSIVAAHVIEIPVPFLFLLPVHSVRVLAFYLQVFLQLCIIITGNYCFFNLLTIVLCLSLLEDDFFFKRNQGKDPWLSKVTQLFTLGVYGGLAYYTYNVFNFKIGSTGVPEMKLSITEAQLEETLKWLVPGSMFLGLSSFCIVVAKDLGKALLDSSSVSRKIPAVLKISVCTAAILFMTAISMVPYSSIRPPSNTEPQLLTAVRPFYARTQRLHLTSSYGLFRRMTGVGGRPEVIIEGANAIEGPWLEYNFRYKPGNVNSSLPIVAPHQPRLDWQMWFAALSTYHTNPWIVSLAYRLLQGQPEVLRLLDEAHNPFPLKPPTYVRATLYTYHYTPWSQRSSKVWWQRERKGEYFPIYSKDHKPLLDYLRQHKFIEGRDWPIRTMWLKELLDTLRRFASKMLMGLGQKSRHANRSGTDPDPLNMH